MGKRFIGFLTAVVLAAGLISGCGAGSANKTSSSGYAGMAAADRSAEGEVVSTAARGVQNEAKSPAEAPAAVETTAATAGDLSVTFSEADSGGSAANPILDQRKVIRSADITLEVENFDQANGRINSAILGIGFVQDTNITTEKVYVDGTLKLVKRGTIVVRVDKEKFDKVLNGFKDIGTVLNFNIHGEDVTEKYFDTESRLKLLRLEEERVIEYLKKLQDPDKIVTYESRLTSLRQEIESLTGTLRKLSDLVDLSTITISMNEKYPGSDQPVKEKTYWEKMGDKFNESMRGVIEFCGNFVIFVVAALPVLILLGLCAWVVIVLYRKIHRTVRRSWSQERVYGNVPGGNAPNSAARPEAPKDGEQNNDKGKE